MFINILLPVYNEEKRLERGVTKTIEYFQSINFDDYCLNIIDNASNDSTEIIGKKLSNKYNKVFYNRLEEKGVGIAFRYGVSKNQCDVVGYMDIDLSTDIKHISDVIDIMQKDSSVKLLNASRLNKHSDTIGRKWYRNITSYGLTFLLKLCLGLKASDSICGFKFFRKEFVEELISQSTKENGWFYIIELLLRAERSGEKIVELPVRWKDDYNTTVNVRALIMNYLKNIHRLRKQFRLEKIL